MPAGKVVLASASPRRRELLQLLVPRFTVTMSDVEETGIVPDIHPQLSPLLFPPPFYLPPTHDPRTWAMLKAVDSARNIHDADGETALVLGADTIVLSEVGVLGKPKSPEVAAEMLRRLRGRNHYVITGFALLSIEGTVVQTACSGATVSRVSMHNFSDEELQGYVATGEPLDKAGAYAVQGLGGKLVEGVEGCVSNVVGLPLCAVRAYLSDARVKTLPLSESGYCSGCRIIEGKLQKPHSPGDGHAA